MNKIQNLPPSQPPDIDTNQDWFPWQERKNWPWWQHHRVCIAHCTVIPLSSIFLHSHGEKDLLDEMVDTKIQVSSADENSLFWPFVNHVNIAQFLFYLFFHIVEALLVHKSWKKNIPCTSMYSKQSSLFWFYEWNIKNQNLVMNIVHTLVDNYLLSVILQLLQLWLCSFPRKEADGY